MSPMVNATAMFAITVSVLVWTLGQVHGHSATTFAFANTSHPTCPLNTVDSSNRKAIFLFFKALAFTKSIVY